MLNNFLASLPFMTETRADMIVSAFLPIVKAGFMVSLPLAVASFLIGMVIAIAVALVRIMPAGGIVRKILLKLVETYISIIRGTPLLVQLVIVFYGLPSVGIYIDPIPAAIIGFSLNVGAYASETIRAAILSVPKGQWEAGRVLGLTRAQTFLRVVLPPSLQRIYPALVSQCIIVMLGSSVVSQVSYEELTFAANLIQSRTFLSFEVYLVTTLIYLLLSIAMRQVLLALGRKWLGAQA